MARKAGATPRPQLRQKFVVCLDPGHGGTNFGCFSPCGLAEKWVALGLALTLRAVLRKRLPHADVVLTRARDTTLPLSERTAAARAAGAHVFLSLHANASRARDQVGFETYVLDAHTSVVEAARAARRVHAQGGVAGGAMHELMAATQRLASIRLAERIQHHQRARFPTRLDRGVKQAPFDVLIGANMPAVLVEAGFLDHARESKLLLSPMGVVRIAEGLCDAISDFYVLRTQLD